MKILASYDGLGCGHVRLTQPLRMMEKHGHEVKMVVSTQPEAIIAMRDARDYDIVIGQRFAGFDGMQLWRRARTPRNRLVYETDDDLFSIDTANWAAYSTFNSPKIREAILGYCELSDLVTVTVEPLAEVHRKYGAASVAVLPNSIPEYVLGMTREKYDRPRIGWVGGGSHGIDVHEAVPAVRRFLAKNDDWDLFIGGTDYRPSFNPKNWDQMIFSEWRQVNEHEADYYESLNFDIGLAPVRDTPFAQSKSALKALEYNARGIPVIASDVAPYRDYITDGENGFIVKTEHDWMRYIRLLASDVALRHEMSRKSKEHAAECTIEQNWRLWEKAYEGLF